MLLIIEFKHLVDLSRSLDLGNKLQVPRIKHLDALLVQVAEQIVVGFVKANDFCACGHWLQLSSHLVKNKEIVGLESTDQDL